MRKKGLGVAVAALAVVAGMVAVAERGTVARARAPSPSGNGPVAYLAMAATSNAAATRTEVRLVDVTDGAGPNGAAHEAWRVGIALAPGAVVRGDVLADGRRVVLVVDDAGAPLRDWAASLHRVDVFGDHVLARGVYHASRPLASADGRVYVERGEAGPWPSRDEARAGRLRTDAIAIDAIDPDSGASRTVATWRGYTMHLAGERGPELVVYRVSFESADLVAIDRATGTVRVIAALTPFARDFSIDSARGAVVMSNRDERDSHLWVVDRIDLATGARDRLMTQRDEAAVPYLTAAGDVRWSSAAPSSPDAPWLAQLAAPGERAETIAGGLR